MGIRLHGTFQDVEIRAGQELRPGERTRSFSDVSSALRFLRGFLNDSLAMTTLRGVAARSLQTAVLSRYSDHDILEQLARHLATGRLYLVPIERSRF
ncbi:MAG TPA: hypothetical protein VKP65_18800, partial [Rhodothermales bacterium]|nr:hypothetical protein [Rhodothermales bacterium]